MSGGHVQLIDLTKAFGDFEAVRRINVDIPAGEFFSLLGPSGCGKTTTLRMIAGFERPTEGRIMLDDRDVAVVPPHKRNVNTVFQNYALFPHLDVFQNVAFGLRFVKPSKDETHRRVGDALALVQLEKFADRRPHQLSGGQQQRVALARALILNPSVLLLDEPLGALDAKLRKSLQIELKALQETVGITFIYVTHDQEEALTMSDRLAVMSEGAIEQVGTPQEVYDEPGSLYVADFLGVSNTMPGVATGANGAGGCRVQLGDFQLLAGSGDVQAQGDVVVVVRPERVRLSDESSALDNSVPGTVERVVYVGATSQVMVRLPFAQSLQVMVANQGRSQQLAAGQRVSVHIPPDALRVLRAHPSASAETDSVEAGGTP
ncbi:MAG TPA: ABC transporter ATP-binding protein [Actinomycetota bacterium]|nr:ABC transporter ATP-binding protein [Actinomycetota bacterium]